MKLLQWNIWYKEDIENILKSLRKIDADIICLQEMTINHQEFNVGINTPEYLAEKLGFNYFFKAAVVNPLDTFGNGIFSRHPIVESSFEFIQDPQYPNIPINDYSSEPRVYIECTVDVGTKKLSVATTHMSYTDKFKATSAKKAEAGKLLEILRKKKGSFIFSGDLNSLPGSHTIHSIQKHLIHAGPDFSENTWTTKPFSYNGFAAETLNWRLDYCFHTPDIEILSAKTIPTEYSDHLPILIEF